MDRRALYEPLIPVVRDVAWGLGYAVGVHGTLRRDLDLIATPWIDDAAGADLLVAEVTRAVGGCQTEPSSKPHGRRAWSIILFQHPPAPKHDPWRYPWIDLSVMPRQ
jgi:hypothetical protein